MVDRPACSGVAVASTVPDRTAASRLVADWIVEVPAAHHRRELLARPLDVRLRDLVGVLELVAQVGYLGPRGLLGADADHQVTAAAGGGEEHDHRRGAARERECILKSESAFIERSADDGAFNSVAN